MGLLTYGLYFLYWTYQNVQVYRHNKGLTQSFWRSLPYVIFFPFWCFFFFREIFQDQFKAISWVINYWGITLAGWFIQPDQMTLYSHKAKTTETLLLMPSSLWQHLLSIVILQVGTTLILAYIQKRINKSTKKTDDNTRFGTFSRGGIIAIVLVLGLGLAPPLISSNFSTNKSPHLKQKHWFVRHVVKSCNKICFTKTWLNFYE